MMEKFIYKYVETIIRRKLTDDEKRIVSVTERVTKEKEFDRIVEKLTNCLEEKEEGE